VAQEQRQWKRAEKYYQKALQIFIEFNARYEQAQTYQSLGAMAGEQQQWEQARDYCLKALEIFVEFDSKYEMGITLRNLALLWQASEDANLPAAVASVLGVAPEEAEKLLRNLPPDE